MLRRCIFRACLRPLGSLLETLVKTALRLLFRQHSAEGVLDLANRRYMMDFGSFAMLGMGHHRWSGLSGRAISTLPENAPTMWEPLWLFALLQGATEIDVRGTEVLHGSACRRFAVRADVPRAAAGSPSDFPLPPAENYGDLLGLLLELWLDGEGRIRRVTLETRLAALRLDLLDFAVAEPSDWTRLPIFRSKQRHN